MKIALVLTAALSLYLLLTSSHSEAETVLNCPENVGCELPDCYCNYRAIPGNIPRDNTPQMILFTYTGALTRRVRATINDLFSDKTNPNECQIGITMFVVTQGSDLCGTYKLYYAGHEVALAGTNRTRTTTNWTEENWLQQIDEQRYYLADQANISIFDMAGMRAQKSAPGGNPQFDMLYKQEYQYDSSLLAGPQKDLNDDLYYWPFTLDRYIIGVDRTIPCFIEKCPSQNYGGLWEVPISPLTSMRNGKNRPCTYLDECFSGASASDVKALLKRHFYHSYNKNRAPFMINLQARTMEFDNIIEGVREFLNDAIHRKDTWIVTIQDALKWVQSPTSQSKIMQSGFWGCAQRGPEISCKVMDGGNSTSKRVFLSYVLNVNDIWIYQTVLLVVLYIALVRYDRDVEARKKK